MTGNMVVFASDEWVAAARALLAELITANADSIRGQQITICEVMENVPADLSGARPDGSRAWHFTVKDGQSAAHDGEIDAAEADMKVVSDYASILPLARKVYVDEPGDAELVDAYRQELVRTGRFRVSGDRSKFPAELGKVLRELHNRLARITA